MIYPSTLSHDMPGGLGGVATATASGWAMERRERGGAGALYALSVLGVE